MALINDDELRNASVLVFANITSLLPTLRHYRHRSPPKPLRVRCSHRRFRCLIPPSSSTPTSAYKNRTCQIACRRRRWPRSGLTGLRARQWYIQPSSATTGAGLYEGLGWLSGALKKQRQQQRRCGAWHTRKILVPALLVGCSSTEGRGRACLAGFSDLAFITSPLFFARARPDGHGGKPGAVN